MKLRSIALAGLLGAGLLMTSGCNEDDVKDLLPKIASVNVVNGTAGNLDVTVDGTEKPVSSYGTFTGFSSTTTDSTVDISFPGNPSTAVSTGDIHVVGINTACADIYIDDKIDDKKIRVMNLSNSSITASTIEITNTNGTSITLPSDVGSCKIVSTYTGSILGIWTIKVNGAQVGSSVDISTSLIAGVELVIYDNSTATVIPIPAI